MCGLANNHWGAVSSGGGVIYNGDGGSERTRDRTDGLIGGFEVCGRGGGRQRQGTVGQVQRGARYA